MNLTICVCGAGTMGRGIAQVAAQAGFDTILYELNTAVLQQAETALRKQLRVLVEKGKIEPGEDLKVLSRMKFVSNLSFCKADFFIEAIIERLDAKIDLFNQLLQINDNNCILATNTSSLSINEIAGGVSKAANVIGMHFFNPAPVMKLVEVVTTAGTAQATLDLTLNVAKRMGKTAVVCRDSPGFIVNRVARPFYIESLRLVEEGIIELEAIDRIMEASGFKMGPFKLMDLIGNDVNFAVSNSVYEQLNHPERLKPSDIQRGKVEKGELGKKTGKGYYRYE